MSVPSWVQDAVFYHIFPDRFANGDPGNDPPNVQPWGTPPTIWGFQGGDLRGIIERFDYLLDLGINALYLNPIFEASSNHRYNTTDYLRIDPRLGTLDDFRALLDLAHRNNIKVILDGVFNHCGRGFFAFYDLLENQVHSAYRDWFHVNRFPIEDAYTPGPAQHYVAWWENKNLPKFNTNTPAVRKYLLDVARYWIELGADGWRLDVPNEIDDDAFWAEFRHVVKSVNPEAYIFGEIWMAEARWVGEGHFDGLMNYPVRDAILRLLYAGTLDIPQFAEKVESLLKVYPRENVHAMYVPLGSHDTERLLTKVEGSVDKAKLAFLFQLAYPGAPAIYYGDEIGMSGGNDPECRGAFPWDRRFWNMELRNWVKHLIAERKRRSALRRGDYLRLCADASSCCLAFARLEGGEKIVVVMNTNTASLELPLPVSELGWEDGRVVRSLLTRKEYVVSDGSLPIMLPPWGGDWLEG
jgi:glycosidase